MATIFNNSRLLPFTRSNMAPNVPFTLNLNLMFPEISKFSDVRPPPPYTYHTLMSYLQVNCPLFLKMAKLFVTQQPNLLSVCNPGFYLNGDICTMCTGNSVKSEVGDNTSCPVVCEGITDVPNSEHSACGKDNYNKYYKR